MFTRRADALLSLEERDRLIATLAFQPHSGDLVPGWGGIRKLRFAAGGRGKRGAFRVVYYLGGGDLPVYALLIYGKNEQVNPSPDEVRVMTALVDRLKRAQRSS